MPILSVRHITRYHYRRPVGFGEHRMMFRPLESYDQRLLESRLTISPEPSALRNIHDVFGNCVGLARFATPARSLVFDSFVRLEHHPAPICADLDDEARATTFPVAYSPEDLPDLIRSMDPHHPDPEGLVAAWARGFLSNRGPTRVLDLLSAMTRAIHADFSYATRLAGGAQSPLQTLALGTGSCRDFAVLMIEAVRSLGLAARFVSGYIYSTKAVENEAGRRGGGHTHAWVRVFLPGHGWVEFDPTNGIIGNTDLIRVAIARDPRQALPLHGAWFGESKDYEGMEVEVDVRVEAAATKRAKAARLALAS